MVVSYWCSALAVPYAPCTLHPAPCTMHPAPCTLQGTLHGATCRVLGVEREASARHAHRQRPAALVPRARCTTSGCRVAGVRVAHPEGEDVLGVEPRRTGFAFLPEGEDADQVSTLSHSWKSPEEALRSALRWAKPDRHLGGSSITPVI